MHSTPLSFSFGIIWLIWLFVKQNMIALHDNWNITNKVLGFVVGFFFFKEKG